MIIVWYIVAELNPSGEKDKLVVSFNPALFTAERSESKNAERIFASKIKI